MKRAKQRDPRQWPPAWRYISSGYFKSCDDYVIIDHRDYFTPEDLTDIPIGTPIPDKLYAGEIGAINCGFQFVGSDQSL